MSIDPFSSATAMLRALSEREISSVELTRFHIDRIENVDGRINAVVVRDFERALESARGADAARTGEGDPPLLGLPMTVCNLSGHPGTAFPAGRSSAGLPIGLQAIGPYLEDRTSLRFAELIEQEFGGFTPPPDFVD